MKDPGTLLTVAQVAERLQCSQRTVRRAIDHGGLRAHQVGQRSAWRVAPADLDAWLEERANTPRPRHLASVPAAGTSVTTSTTVRGRAAARRQRGVSGVLSVPREARGR